MQVTLHWPNVAFHDLVTGKVDLVGVEVVHEAGITDASLTLQLESGSIEIKRVGGISQPVANAPLPGNTGHRWSFKNLPPTEWNFRVWVERK